MLIRRQEGSQIIPWMKNKTEPNQIVSVWAIKNGLAWLSSIGWPELVLPSRIRVVVNARDSGLICRKRDRSRQLFTIAIRLDKEDCYTGMADPCRPMVQHHGWRWSRWRFRGLGGDCSNRRRRWRGAQVTVVRWLERAPIGRSKLMTEVCRDRIAGSLCAFSVEWRHKTMSGLHLGWPSVMPGVNQQWLGGPNLLRLAENDSERWRFFAFTCSGWRLLSPFPATGSLSGGLERIGSTEGCVRSKLDVKARTTVALAGWRQAPKLVCCSLSNAQHRDFPRFSGIGKGLRRRGLAPTAPGGWRLLLGNGGGHRNILWWRARLPQASLLSLSSSSWFARQGRAWQWLEKELWWVGCWAWLLLGEGYGRWSWREKKLRQMIGEEGSSVPSFWWWVWWGIYRWRSTSVVPWFMASEPHQTFHDSSPVIFTKLRSYPLHSFFHDLPKI